MKASELLEARRAYWRDLERLCFWMEGRWRIALPADTITRFSTLYRAACADLALADAYQLPPATIDYLHRLVGRAHNQLYRAGTFKTSTWFRQLFVEVPQRLFADNCLRLAMVIFWGVFLLSAYMAANTEGYAEQVIRRPLMDKLEEDFSRSAADRGPEVVGPGSGMAGFYIFNNAGIGLKCFAFGLLLGVGGLPILLFNAALLGACFGHMYTTPQWTNFYQFVTAHGPFELTAIVLSAAAGMRLGFSLVDTGGYTRLASLRRAAKVAMPTISAAVVMFLMAALIEGFLSPSGAPYQVKVAVAVLSAAMLLFYIVVLGYPRGD